MQKIKNFITKGIIGLFMLGAFAAPAFAGGAAYAADPIQDPLCSGAASLEFGSNKDCSATDDAEGGINDLIAQVINIFSVIVGVVAVIMIIVGGFRYITSGGDSGNVTSAKNTILYAIVGLVIVALAQFIVKFVLSKATA